MGIIVVLVNIKVLFTVLQGRLVIKVQLLSLMT